MGWVATFFFNIKKKEGPFSKFKLLFLILRKKIRNLALLRQIYYTHYFENLIILNFYFKNAFFVIYMNFKRRVIIFSCKMGRLEFF